MSTLPPRRAHPASLALRGWLALAASCLLAACGVSPREAALVVMEPGSFFSPGTLTIPAGTTVIWRNQDRLAHTVTGSALLQTSTFELEGGLPAGVEPYDSGDLFAGHTWQHTFDTPGQYVYYCRYHAGEQMLATLVVQAPP